MELLDKSGIGMCLSPPQRLLVVRGVLAWMESPEKYEQRLNTYSADSAHSENPFMKTRRLCRREGMCPCKSEMPFSRNMIWDGL